MYVNRMRFLNVKPLHLDIPEGGAALLEPARHRLLLQGANGSGKSTILESILTLWKFWGEWLDENQGLAPGKVFPAPEEHRSHFLASAGLAAVEISGMISDFDRRKAVEIGSQPKERSIWIGTGSMSEVRAFRDANTGTPFAGMVRSRSDWTIESGPSPYDDMVDLRHRSLAGSEMFPNIVYFPPEGRTLRSRLPVPAQRGEIMDTTGFNWTAVYEPDVNLDSVLLTVKALNADRFDECLRLINLALEHRQKRITGFGPKGRLIVEGKTEAGVSFQHPIDELSSGEQEMLLLVGFVVAFLRPGGIVLLDEPDLHIHIGMVSQLMGMLERVVRERNGQLIVASHSQLVWNWFALKAEKIALGDWRGGQK